MKVLGTRHCFNRIAESAYKFLSVKEFDNVVELDERARTVTVEPGIRYGQLGPILDGKGFDLGRTWPLGLLVRYRRGLGEIA
jgi:xylitol oxidase